MNVVNNRGDTPLHLAVTLEPSNERVLIFTDMLKVLFDGGAHHDFVNNDGKTPMAIAQTDEARMILSSEKRKLELKCISAGAVKKFGIPYSGWCPKHWRNMVACIKYIRLFTRYDLIDIDVL